MQTITLPVKSLVLGAIVSLMCSVLYADPKPGDVFKEVVMKAPNSRGYEIVAGSQNIKPSDPGFKNLKFKTPNFDLTGVKRVEIRMEIWSGHYQTNVRYIRFNQKPWVKLTDNPLPNDRALLPKKDIGQYMAFIYSTTEIPLADLKSGANDFDFECEGGDWELFDWWAITYRFYYDAATPAPKGTITSPLPGASIGDLAEFKVDAISPNGAIKQVEFLGWYEDFNYTRDGIHQNWQYKTYYGEYQDHVGTSTTSPFTVNWNTEWIPDQTVPMKFMARITDAQGYTTITPIVEGVKLSRSTNSVRLYKAFDLDIPGTATKEKPTIHKLDTLKEDLSKAKDAKGYIVTYHGISCAGVFINDTKIAEKLSNANYIYDANVLPIPLTTLKTGVNTVRIESVDPASAHGTDVTWPGLEIKVRYTGLAPLQPTVLANPSQKAFKSRRKIGRWIQFDQHGVNGQKRKGLFE